MANNDVPEDMEVDERYFEPTPSPTPTDTSIMALMASSRDKDNVQAILSFKWSEDVPLQKCHHNLLKVLQTWSNTNKLDADCKVLKVSEDGKVEIRLTPASGKPIPASELQKLSGQALQGKDGNTVTILSVTLTPLRLETKQPSTNLPPSPDVDVPRKEQSSSVSTEEEKKEEVACTLSVGPFWYVSHIYKKEMERIEKENGVKITSDVKITFEAKKDGSPEKALSEFTSLVQKYSSDLEASHIPLKHVDPEELKEVMMITQRKGSTLLLTPMPEEMISWGPRQSQDTIRKASGGPVWNGTSGNNTEAPTGGGATAGYNQEDNCSICLDTFTNKKQLKCKHEFCEACLEQSKASMGPTCPLCKDVFGMMEGDQPDGKMTTEKRTFQLDGYPGCGTIIINYNIPSGNQTAKHPHPGKYLYSCHRTAYLPDNKEGREVLHLLKKAFKQKLIFTVGTSRTSGMDDVVTWNDIPHKTSTSGGPQSFGYPDPRYLGRVREELKAKGIE